VSESALTAVAEALYDGENDDLGIDWHAEGWAEAWASIILDRLRKLPVEQRMEAMGMVKVERAWWTPDLGVGLSLTGSVKRRPHERPLFVEATDA